MTIPTAFLALVAIIVVGVFIAQPFFSTRRTIAGGGGRQTASDFRQQAALFAERNRIYAALRDLDFDFKTNKFSDEHYAAERYQLVAQGIEVLQKLDGLPVFDQTPEEDSIEMAIAAIRAGREIDETLFDDGAEPTGEAAGYCPNCGEPHYTGDRFCGECGTKL
jgi:hypothetical protein